MSGMVNPFPNVRAPREPQSQTEQKTPDTMSNRLGKLNKNEAGPVKVDEQGRITEGGFGISLRSGLNAFGFGKPTDDIVSNRTTLNNVMQLLYDEARQVMVDQNAKWKEEGHENWQLNPDTYAQKVMDALYQSKTFLYGDSKFLGKTDPGYSIEQRIDRGTYLSGELAGQIKFRFDEIVHNSIEKTTGNLVIRDEKYKQARLEEANRRGENLERLGPTNQDSVKRFLGQEVKNEGVISTLVNVGAGIVDGIKGAIDSLTRTETRDTAFERTLLQIREQGTKHHPPSDTKFWDAFEQHWTEAMTAPENTIQGSDLKFVQGKLEQYANQMAREGKIVDEKMLNEHTTKLLTNGFTLGRIGDLVNHEYVTKATVEDISKAIEVWRDQQPDEIRQQISQNDCEWLAGEIKKSMEGERLMMERAPNFLTAFKDWSSNFGGFDEKYNKFGSSPVIARIYETIARNYEQMEVPYSMPTMERAKHYLHKYDGDIKGQLKGWMEVALPPKWGPKELAGLIGDSIKEVLLDRHERITQRMPELQQNRESREILQDNLEMFPLLKAQGNRFFDHPEVLKHNPEKPSEFVGAIVANPIIAARTLVEMQRQIASGEWKTNLPPEPPKPQDGAPQSEIDKYEVDKKQYDRLLGEEHGRFMKDAAVVRDIARTVFDVNVGKFEVLDEIQQTVQDLQGLDLKNMSPEQMQELGARLDELRKKSEDMWSYAFGLINDTNRRMEITDQEATAILSAVTGSWCDIDAILNTIELDAGRAQFEIGQLLESPRLETSHEALGKTETNLRLALGESLNALESGDRRKMERTSDELKRQLISSYEIAYQLYTERGPEEPQARQLLEMIDKATRVGVELGRTPELRGREETVPGWDEHARHLLPSYLDLPGARNAPRPYETDRSQTESIQRTQNENRMFREGVEERLGALPQPPTEPFERPSWMTTGLHQGIAPFPSLQEYMEDIDGSRSVLDLVERSVLRSTRDQMAGEQRTSFETRWDQNVAPGLVALESFEPVPPPPEHISRDTVRQYRDDLMKYIGTTARLLETVQSTSTELLNMVGQSTGDTDHEALSRASRAVNPVLTQIGEHLILAQQRLEALN